jgi:hypothetical protein
MKYKAQILGFNEEVEEEVILQVGTTVLHCFSHGFPYQIEKGDFVSVEFELQFFDELQIEEIESNTCQFKRIGESFSYLIQGELDGNVLKSDSISFQDDCFVSECGFLNGKMVSLRVDRIDVDFLEKENP